MKILVIGGQSVSAPGNREGLTEVRARGNHCRRWPDGPASCARRVSTVDPAGHDASCVGRNRGIERVKKGSLDRNSSGDRADVSIAKE